MLTQHGSTNIRVLKVPFMTITLLQCWWSVPVLGNINEDNTEAAIKNEQSNETDNIGYPGRRKTRQKKTHNIFWTPLYTNKQEIVLHRYTISMI